MSRPAEAATPAPSLPAALRRAVASFALLRESPVAIVGAALIGFWIAVALLAPWLATFEPNATLQPFAKPGTAFAAGSGTFWLGTDPLGRDILSRLIWGSRTVLIFAPVATAVAYAVGIAMGLAAGYFRGWIDEALSFLANVILSFPVLVLYILIITTIGASGLNIIIAITFASAPGVMRIVRGLVLDLRNREYVAAAQTRGEGAWYIMLVEILPNARGPLIVDACLRLGYVVITIGVLGFLGLGLPPPDPDWGGMINEARGVALAFPHMTVFPCLAISSLILGFNLLADGLREISLRIEMTGTGPEGASFLEIDRLSVSYLTRAGEIPAVIDFSLRVAAGESVGLVGESGCGKSTVAFALLRALGRNGEIAAGCVRFRGRDLAKLNAAELRALRGGEIAMVYQEPMAALNPSLTIATQLSEVPMVHAGVGRAEAGRRATAMLADVGLGDPERVLAAYPHQLSGGQQQRVVIAMALLGNPSLLLLDEPTTALDVTVEAGIVKLIGELGRRFGTAQLYISHNLGLIREICTRVCVMYAGQVVEEGPVEALFRRPRHPYTQGLLACIPLPASDKNARPLAPIPGQLPPPLARPSGCVFAPRCAFAQAGRCDAAPIAMEPTDAPLHAVRCVRWREIASEEVAAPPPTRAPAPLGDEVLRVEGLQKHYTVSGGGIGALISREGLRTVRANEALEMSARARETVAIVGESGCGKSTFARVLMGLETATAGSVNFAGDEISRTPVAERTREQVGALQMVFQNPDETLNPSRSIGAQIARVVRKFGIEREPARIRARVHELLDTVKLPVEFSRRRPRQLSGGQKQRVGIARAFAGNPRMVIADEPISALDVSVAAAVTELLMDIQREHGTTLLFISHDLGIVRYLADRVVVMYLGQIMERGTTAEIFTPPYHPYTEALLAAAPMVDPGVTKREIVLEGPLPLALDPPAGCPFVTRCPRKVGRICEVEPPPRREPAPGHVIACHIPLAELAAVEPVFSIAGEEGAQ